MSLISSGKAKAWVIGIAGCVLLLLVLLLLWPRGAPATLDVRLVGVSRSGGGVLRVNVLLTNRTSRTLNVIDDSRGNPAFVLDEIGGPSPSGSWGARVTDMANSLRINLAPGASLTSTVWLTNPPPRFRLRAQIRDLAAERGDAPWSRIVGGPLARQILRLREKAQDSDAYAEVYLPASVWIEPKGAQE
jgi:hypothetical protein